MVQAPLNRLAPSPLTLQDFYSAYAHGLSAQFPDNHNVEAKIRQQLQVLPNGGVLTFLEPGKYLVIA